ATIDPGWHLYSQDVPDGGPIPTYFEFQENPDYKLVGKVKEEGGITENDPVFEMIITYFENKTSFTQRIKLTGNKGTTVTGEVEFMVCDDTNCLPPTYVDLNFDIPAPAASAVENTEKTSETTAASDDTNLTDSEDQQEDVAEAQEND